MSIHRLLKALGAYTLPDEDIALYEATTAESSRIQENSATTASENDAAAQELLEDPHVVRELCAGLADLIGGRVKPWDEVKSNG